MQEVNLIPILCVVVNLYLWKANIPNKYCYNKKLYSYYNNRVFK